MIMKWIRAVFVLILAACDGSPPRDVPYYKTHDQERADKIAQCDADPGHLDLSPNCRNAHEAQNERVFAPGNRGVPRI